MKKRYLSAVMLFSFILILFSTAVFAQTPEEAAKEQLKAELLLHQETVDLSAHLLSEESVQVIWEDLRQNTPEFFFVDSLSLTLSKTDPAHVTLATPVYNMNAEESSAALAFCQEQVSQCISGLANGNSDTERLLSLQKHLVATYKLSDATGTAYSFFQNRMGDSHAFALAFQMICEAMNIDCTLIRSASMNRSWNAVKVENSRYHVDIAADAAASQFPAVLSRKHFLLSDTKLNALGYQDYPTGSCTSLQYDDAIWQISDRAILRTGGYLFYIHQEGSIYRCSSYTDKGTLFTQIDTPWLGSEGVPIQKSYTDLAAHKHFLYYNTPHEIRCIDTDTKEITTVLTPALSEDLQIIGFEANSGGLSYYISADLSGSSLQTEHYSFPAEEQFSIVFISESNIIHTEHLTYGQKILVPEVIPSKAATDKGRYEFAGWSGYREGMIATNDSVFKAEFTFIPYTTVAPTQVPGPTSQAPSSTVFQTRPTRPVFSTRPPFMTSHTNSSSPVFTVTPGTVITPVTTPTPSTTVSPTTTIPYGGGKPPSYTHLLPQISGTQNEGWNPLDPDYNIEGNEQSKAPDGTVNAALPWIIAISGSVIVVGFIILRETVLIPKKKKKNELPQATESPAALSESTESSEKSSTEESTSKTAHNTLENKQGEENNE